MSHIARFLAAVLLVLGFAASASALEQIDSFHALVDIGADATLTVTETISVNAEGRKISRGIFRDIPLRYEDADGHMREVRLDVRSVTRNGMREPFTVERGTGVLRIRIGSADTALPHGRHIYAITYETARQIRYFDDHDELYWNVTGNGWDFPILKSSAEIRLPAGARATDIAWFTGYYGSTEQAARAERIDGGNRIIIEATRALAPREGLTVVVAFPQGVVAPLSMAERNADWWQDNLAWIFGAGGLMAALAFYLWAWRRVGRDPPADIVVPRWTPPEGISPALANYIEKRGFRGGGWDAFSASIIDLAVKGHIEIDQPKKTMTIRRKGNGVPEGMGAEQKAILNVLPADGDTLTVDKTNGETVQSVGSKFRKAMETEHRNQFYRSNLIYVAGGGVISAIVLAFVIAMQGRASNIIMLIWGIGVPSTVIAAIAAQIGRQFRQAYTLAKRIMAVIVSAFVGFIGLNILSHLLSVIAPREFDQRALAVIAALIIINVVFFFLMGAPTPIGQKRSAEIAGLKQYLTLAEKDRMNMRDAPEMSPQHFETLLPYAVALGVEKPWSRAFEAWVATALAAGVAAYAGPIWFHGADFSPGSLGDSLGGIGGRLSNSFTASLPVQSSSSSGFSSGGGFSGGGGGGGGGGGW